MNFNNKFQIFPYMNLLNKKQQEEYKIIERCSYFLKKDFFNFKAFLMYKLGAESWISFKLLPIAYILCSCSCHRHHHPRQSRTSRSLRHPNICSRNFKASSSGRHLEHLLKVLQSTSATILSLYNHFLVMAQALNHQSNQRERSNGLSQRDIHRLLKYLRSNTRSRHSYSSLQL